MSKNPETQAILAEAQEHENRYDWIAAAESYTKALNLLSDEAPPIKGTLIEKRGYALYRAAFQASSSEEFHARRKEAQASYEQASNLYAASKSPADLGRKLRCDAMIQYLEYWLESQVPEKKRKLSEAWKLAKESLKLLAEADEKSEYTQSLLLFSPAIILHFSYDYDFNFIQEAMQYAEKSLSFASHLGDPSKLARAYVQTAVLGEILALNISEPIKKQECERRMKSYWKEAKKLSEEAALQQLTETPILTLLFWPGDAEAITTSTQGLEIAKGSKDRLHIGLSLDQLALHTFWREVGREDPDEGRRLLDDASNYSAQAREQYSAFSFVSPRGGAFWTEAPETEYYWRYAGLETDAAKKRELLKKAVDAAPNMLKRAEDSGYFETIVTAHHVSSKALAALAETEADIEVKKKLLLQALEERNRFNEFEAKIRAYHYWDRGVGQNYLANIHSELSEIAENKEEKRKLLIEAVRAKDACLDLCGKYLESADPAQGVSFSAWLGERQLEYGDLLLRLQNIDANRSQLTKAAEAFITAASLFEKSNHASGVAECRWRAAQIHDLLNEHSEAAEDFTSAATAYTNAATKIAQLKSFYEDYSSYMRAWSEIEKARYHHSRQEYKEAKECYQKAAELHKSTSHWTYLTPNYSAWANLEDAEELSRSERSAEAIQAFNKAANLFQAAQQSVKGELPKIEDSREKEMAALLINAASPRTDYCKARVALEEAKILDRDGDHQASSQKYGRAAEIFSKIEQGAESERDRREIKFIAILSQAWQMMARAEAEASPELYLQASRLFEEAKEATLNEKMKLLTLGHSRFCRALEAGARFTDTHDPEKHSQAVQDLQSAADYYVKAGFQKSADFAKASKLLFDAYLYMNNADREKDQEKKTKLFVMAEKVLQASSDSYKKAGYSGKGEEVRRLLEKAREERELAASLTEVLHAPSIVSTTTSFPTPSPSHEQAVGLERFEHADVHASVIADKRELKVGEDLDLELELVNSGRGIAQLVKMEEFMPDGFELVTKPEAYRVEDTHLNMKGRQLGPLKTEEVRFVLKPKVQGQFLLKPRILYLDESGEYRSHEPQPVEVSVRELGVSGWLRGTRY